MSENNIVFEDEEPLNKAPAVVKPRGRQETSTRGRVETGVSRESEHYYNFTTGSLEIPQRYIDQIKQMGYHLRWVRIMSQGEVDSPNIIKKLRQGYTFLTPEEAPELAANYAVAMDVGQWKGVLAYGDVALMKRSLEIQDEHKRQMEEMNARVDLDQDAQNNGIRKVKGEHKSESQVLRSRTKPKFGG